MAKMARPMTPNERQFILTKKFAPYTVLGSDDKLGLDFGIYIKGVARFKTEAKKTFTNSITCECAICGGVDNYTRSQIKDGKVLICKKCNKEDYKIGKPTFDGSLIKVDTFIYSPDGAIGVRLVCSRCSRTSVVHYDRVKNTYCTFCGANKQFVDERKKIVEAAKKADIIKNEPVVKSSRAVAEPVKPISRPVKTVEVQPKTENKVENTAENKVKPKNRAKMYLGGLVSTDEEVKSTLNSEDRAGESFLIIGKYRTKTKKDGSPLTNEIAYAELQCVKCGYVKRLNIKSYKYSKSLSNLDDENLKCPCSYEDAVGYREYQTKFAKLSSANRFREPNKWKGYVKNNLRVTKVINGKIPRVELECIMCGNKYPKDIPLVSLELSENLMCLNCSQTKFKVDCLIKRTADRTSACDKCDYKMTVTPFDLYCNSDRGNIFKICSKNPGFHRGTPIGILSTEFRNQVKLSIANDKIKEFKYLGEYSGLNGTFFKFKEGYLSRKCNLKDINEKEDLYRTCFCVEHSKFIPIRDCDIEEYNHELCADERVLVSHSVPKELDEED